MSIKVPSVTTEPLDNRVPRRLSQAIDLGQHVARRPLDADVEGHLLVVHEQERSNSRVVANVHDGVVNSEGAVDDAVRGCLLDVYCLVCVHWQ